MKICGIYKITNVVNGKMIIGQSRNIVKRWRCYKNKLNRNQWANGYLQSAWNKYGEQNFKFEILFECSLVKLDEEEVKTIKKYQSNDREYGYNLTDGGSTPKYSEETKQKLRNAFLGRYDGEKHPGYGKKRSKETVQNMRNSHMGIKNHNYGKAMSEEQKLKISIARKEYFARKKLETKLLPL